MAKAVWMVRAQGGSLFEEFKDKGLVAMGLTIGPIANIKKAEIEGKIRAQIPGWKEGKIAVWAAMLFRFQNEVAIGDGIVTYDPSTRKYLVGTIAGQCEYDETTLPGDPFLRRVQWRGEVARDALTVPSKNSLGAIATFFRVPSEAAMDLERALKGGPALAEISVELSEGEDEKELLEDVTARALEFIKDRLSKLDWEDMQRLVAGLLRAMGYKTRISPAGADRGRDIIASPDGFGFENPRIVVEVKHRPSSTMGSQEIRSFLGGRHRDDKGLYVSTGGFSKDAKYEADRATIPLTLMDADDLVHAIVEYYDRMDIETQALLPLRKVYWPG
ncbi:MAG TPA: restriction endonuclease [Usitatibacter sp.]|nr:restriction endonuclease [Usitatibacter sp.]